MKGELRNMSVFTAARFNCDKLKLQELYLKPETNLNNINKVSSCVTENICTSRLMLFNKIIAVILRVT